MPLPPICLSTARTLRPPTLLTHPALVIGAKTCTESEGDTPAGQAYYDSLFRLYAAWGLDFVKVDDMSRPYHTAEIEAVRKAIDKCGRTIVLSLSPGADAGGTGRARRRPRQHVARGR